MFYYGHEKLILDGKELPYSMLDFWRNSLSNILLNMTRGTFAEFLVKCALMYEGYDTFMQEKTGIEAWDIDGPPLTAADGRRKSRIEVKSAASIQMNTPDEKEPLRLKDTQLQFSIKRALDWTNVEAGINHNNDLYVFAHYTAEYKACNMLDLRFWEFYVYPTFKIDEDSKLSKQKSISVYRLKKLGVQAQTFDTLYTEIMRTIEEISAHYTQEKDVGEIAVESCDVLKQVDSVE